MEPVASCPHDVVLEGIYRPRVVGSITDHIMPESGLALVVAAHELPYPFGLGRLDGNAQRGFDFLVAHPQHGVRTVTVRNGEGMDLLPYHKMGVGKYGQLDKPYPIEGDPSLSQEDLDRIEGWMKAYDFPVTVVRH